MAPPPFKNCLEVSVDTKNGEDQLHQTLWQTCTSIHPGWKDVKREEIKVDMISGGITNLLYKCTAGDAEQLLVRVYGDKTDLIIDREKECKTLKQMSDSEFAVPYFGSFANGRIEGWRVMRPLKPEEMSSRAPVDFQTLIAGQMAAMHELDIQEPDNEQKIPQLFVITEGWAQSALRIDFDDQPEARRKLFARCNVPKMFEELKWMMTIMPSASNQYGEGLIAEMKDDAAKAAAKFAFTPVFAHNDVLCGNVLVDEKMDPPNCQLIDFEYGCYNYRMFDVANHFCEYSGYDGDWGKWHPMDEEMLYFLKAYVNSSKAGKAVYEGLPDDDARERFMQELLKWSSLFCLTSQLFWGFWCVIQAKYSPIDFDFMDYCRIRFVGYTHNKGLYSRYLFKHE